MNGDRPSRRGVAYWPGGDTDSTRIVFGAGRLLIAVTVDTGTAANDLGLESQVDLVVPSDSVPLICSDIVVVEETLSPSGHRGVGNARAFDVRHRGKDS